LLGPRIKKKAAKKGMVDAKKGKERQRIGACNVTKQTHNTTNTSLFFVIYFIFLCPHIKKKAGIQVGEILFIFMHADI